MKIEYAQGFKVRLEGTRWYGIRNRNNCLIVAMFNDDFCAKEYQKKDWPTYGEVVALEITP